MRIQILELPTEHVAELMNTPFVVVISEAREEQQQLLQYMSTERPAEQIGAKAVWVFEDAVEIGEAPLVELSDRPECARLREEESRKVADVDWGSPELPTEKAKRQAEVDLQPLIEAVDRIQMLAAVTDTPRFFEDDETRAARLAHKESQKLWLRSADFEQKLTIELQSEEMLTVSGPRGVRHYQFDADGVLAETMRMGA